MTTKKPPRNLLNDYPKRRPKTDAQALKTCQYCIYLKNDRCEHLGEITVASRHECFLRGLAWIEFNSNQYDGKIPRAGGCE